MDDKKKLINRFKRAAYKIQEILEEFADDPKDLTDEEKMDILKNYDIMTVHGSISLEQLQE